MLTLMHQEGVFNPPNLQDYILMWLMSVGMRTLFCGGAYNPLPCSNNMCMQDALNISLRVIACVVLLL